MFGADGRRNDRVDRKLATFDRGVLGRAEKSRRVNNASVSEICRQVIVSRGGYFDRGGDDFVQNRCEGHVTIKGSACIKLVSSKD